MIVNRTGTVLRIYSEGRPDGIAGLDDGLLWVIQPEPTAAGLDVTPVSAERRTGIPVELVQFGHVTGLAEPDAGVYQVVPLHVGIALADRREDLLVPYREVRDAAGTVIGYRTLAQPI